jgi:hypothetical protein
LKPKIPKTTFRFCADSVFDHRRRIQKREQRCRGDGRLQRLLRAPRAISKDAQRFRTNLSSALSCLGGAEVEELFG